MVWIKLGMGIACMAVAYYGSQHASQGWKISGLAALVIVQVLVRKQ